MGHFGDGLRALTTTIKNVFRTPTTVHYPAQKRERSERYRNTFALLHDTEGDELCVGCLQCERICPSQVITVIAEKKESPVTGKRRGYATDFVLDLNACIYCELCVQVCPTDAIVMTRTPERPGYSREELCLTMDRLYENETAKPLTWGTASKLMEMQDPKRGAPPPEKKSAPAKQPAAAAGPKPGSASGDESVAASGEAPVAEKPLPTSEAPEPKPNVPQATAPPKEPPPDPEPK
jgi:NADH-quinone oxidoreductase subunit I